MIDVDKTRLVALFREYDEKDNLVTQKKAELDEAIKQRSNTVKDILSANGGKKRIRRDGREMSIVVRGETNFFRGGKGDDITEV